nr:TlpA disulfide reductase family protein [uncultured Flavobacterium sp.]
MRNILFSVLAVMFFSSLAFAQRAYVINGRVGFDGTAMAYLRDMELNVRDSSVVMNKSFTFRGKLQHPELFSIDFDFSPYVGTIFLENSSYFVDVKLDPFEFVSNGGLLDSLYNEFNANRKISFTTLYDLDRIMKAYSLSTSEEVSALKIQLKNLAHFIDSSQFVLDTMFLNQVKGTHLAPYLITTVYSTRKHLSFLKDYYGRLDDSFKNAPAGKYLLRKIERLIETVSVGDAIGDFSLVDINGNIKTNKNILKQKYTLIDFWASWCKPCIEEFPILKNADSLYRDLGFSIISISMDREPKQWTNALKINQLHWDQFIENDLDPNRLSKRLGIKSIPSNFLVDENFRIVAINLRGEQLLLKLEELLKSK